MVEPPSYAIERRELIAESAGLRVQVLTLGPGQAVPWHWHTAIADSFFCLAGTLVVETRDPVAKYELGRGERAEVPPGVAHTVRSAGGAGCRFLIVQGVGEYDYLTE